LEARAQAGLGPARHRESREALRRAEAILARLNEGSRDSSAFSYNEAQLRFHEGSAYTHLHDSSTAWTAQRRALELVPEADYTDRTLTHLDRAICLAYDGDGATAVTYALQALINLDENQRYGIIDMRARDALRAIPAPQRSLPAAREFRDFLMIPGDSEEEK
jgi:hypothetical protein